MFIRSKHDYDLIISSMKKTANEVKGTYEVLGDCCRFIGTTKGLKEIFEISDAFEEAFIESVTHFRAVQIGPYITEKYFLLIPAVKKALEQITDDCIETRRCIIRFPEEHCFQTMQFIVRENTVHILCHMRSCDAVKNLPYDMWLCSKMADIFAHYYEELTGQHPYEYRAITMMFGSLHVYKEDVSDVF